MSIVMTRVLFRPHGPETVSSDPICDETVSRVSATVILVLFRTQGPRTVLSDPLSVVGLFRANLTRWHLCRSDLIGQDRFRWPPVYEGGAVS